MVRVVAVTVALVLTVSGCASGGAAEQAGSSTGGAATTADTPAGGPLTLPDTVGGLAAATASSGSGPSASAVSRLASTADLVAGRVADAYGGAPAAARTYLSDDLQLQLLVMAVRAPSPGLFVTSADAEEVGLAKPVEEVVVVGDVQCLVRNDVVPAGQTPGDARVQRCQRSGPALTVMVDPGMVPDVQGTAAIVDEVWSALGG